jgi:uncharacterized protein (DUF2252 family)
MCCLTKIQRLSLLIAVSWLIWALPAAGERLNDVSYSFDQSKLAAAKDSFHFLRSFVDYFYLLVKANASTFKIYPSTENVSGWCVGDAHPENFGVVLLHGSQPLFTMNDMDDSGPCPVVLDILRLMVSSRLYDANTTLDKMLDAYTQGLRHKRYDMPSAVQDLIRKAKKQGTVPNPKKVNKNKLVRDDQAAEVNSSLRAQIERTVMSVVSPYLAKDTKIIDMLATSKVGGGSGGLQRYEVLIQNGGSLLHLELKEQREPAIYPVETNKPGTAQRIATTLRMDQGPTASVFYQVVQIGSTSMLLRPRFAGNVGVSLDKGSASDNKDIIRYEAYTLGMIHSRSLSSPEAWEKMLADISEKAWEHDVELLTDQFQQKFKKLK